MNLSKQSDPRMMARWRISGALGTIKNNVAVKVKVPQVTAINGNPKGAELLKTIKKCREMLAAGKKMTGIPGHKGFMKVADLLAEAQAELATFSLIVN